MNPGVLLSVIKGVKDLPSRRCIKYSIKRVQSVQWKIT